MHYFSFSVWLYDNVFKVHPHGTLDFNLSFGRIMFPCLEGTASRIRSPVHGHLGRFPHFGGCAVNIDVLVSVFNVLGVYTDSEIAGNPVFIFLRNHQTVLCSPGHSSPGHSCLCR